MNNEQLCAQELQQTLQKYNFKFQVVPEYKIVLAPLDPSEVPQPAETPSTETATTPEETTAVEASPEAPTEQPQEAPQAPAGNE